MINIFEKQINYNFLKAKIKEEQDKKTSRVIDYLVMNSNTLHIMWNDYAPTEKWNNKGSSYNTYCGIPIAICEKLQDGDIDIV